MTDRYAPSTITAAVTGGDVLPSQSEYIPRGAKWIADEAVKAAEAGAACVHIHAREEDGRPSAAPGLFKEIVDSIRSRSDVVINITTGGTIGMSVEDRLAGMEACRPDIATFNLGTINYEGFPSKERWPEVDADWERETVEASGSVIFANTLDDMRMFARRLRDAGVTPELEAYDAGHLSMARFLLDEGTLEGPVRIQLVLGVLGGAGNSVDELFHMRAMARDILGPHIGRLAVAATGYPMQLRGAAVAMASGMDCRVGMEDSIRLHRKVLAKSNAELVAAAAGIADAVGRPLQTAAGLRASLGPWSNPA